MVPPRLRPRPYASAIELGPIPAEGKITQDIAHLNLFREPEYKSKSDPENATQVQNQKLVNSPSPATEVQTKKRKTIIVTTSAQSSLRL